MKFIRLSELNEITLCTWYQLVTGNLINTFSASFVCSWPKDKAFQVFCLFLIYKGPINEYFWTKIEIHPRPSLDLSYCISQT